MLLPLIFVAGILVFFCLATLGYQLWQCRSRSYRTFLLAIPLIFFSCMTYAFVGNPGMSDAPFVQRLQVPLDALPEEALVTIAEIHLIENPTDIQGWKKLAPLYLSIKQYKKAAQAYDYAISLNQESHASSQQENALLAEGLGIALYHMAQKTLLPHAQKSLERAIALDPRRVLSVSLLTRADVQNRQYHQATARLKRLITDLPHEPEGEVYRQFLQQIQDEMQQ